MQYSYESIQLLNYTSSGEFGQYNRYIGNLINLNFSVILGDILDRFKFHNGREELATFKKYKGSWFYYLVEDCKERTCLSKYQQNQVLNLLEKYQILISRKIGIQSKRYIRLNIFALNLFLLHTEKVIKYFNDNPQKEIKDFCEENNIKGCENVLNNSEFNEDSKPSSRQETLPLGGQETLPLGGQETLPPIIMNLNNEPKLKRTMKKKNNEENAHCSSFQEIKKLIPEANKGAINFWLKTWGYDVVLSAVKLTLSRKNVANKAGYTRKILTYGITDLNESDLNNKALAEEYAQVNKSIKVNKYYAVLGKDKEVYYKMGNQEFENILKNEFRGDEEIVSIENMLGEEYVDYLSKQDARQGLTEIALQSI